VAMKREVRIYCPKCAWEPGPGDRWSCTCGCAWNTFTTFGKCPTCGREWNQTQCLSCARWSPHQDWYHEMQGDDSGVHEHQPAEAGAGR
jgi:hypothetical protein